MNRFATFLVLWVTMSASIGLLFGAVGRYVVGNDGHVLRCYQRGGTWDVARGFCTRSTLPVPLRPG